MTFRGLNRVQFHKARLRFAFLHSYLHTALSQRRSEYLLAVIQIIMCAGIV